MHWRDVWVVSGTLGGVPVVSRTAKGMLSVNKQNARGVETPRGHNGKLTIAKIESAEIPDGKTQVLLWDAAVGGLYLRCFAGGGRSWMYRYRADGGGRAAKLRAVKLGSYPALSLDAARDAARTHAGQVAKGHDPAAERRALRAQARAETLGDLLAQHGVYEKALRRRELVNWKVALSSLRRELKPLMGQEPKTLTRKDLVRRITALEDADLRGAAADLRKFSYSLFEWCVQHDHAPSNPLAGWKRPPKTRAQRLAADEPNGKALDDEEIVRLWRAADAVGGAAFGPLVQLGLLTALRRGELGHLRWKDVHDDRIVLTAGATKMGKRHEIPLTPLMRQVLASVPKTSSSLVFPSSVTGGPLRGWTKLVAKLQQASGVDFALHDLRRTCRTLMTRVGVGKDDAELSIGHSREALVKLYDFDQRWNVRVDAFQRVSDHIEKLIGTVLVSPHWRRDQRRPAVRGSVNP